jgi:esterase/lipase superfamily enzyme
MQREYYKWYSPHLHKEMELLVFGHSGTPVLFFPTRAARFYDYENWKVIDAISDKIENGFLQVYCVDSNDGQSFYCPWLPPCQKIIRHLHYEQYILHEVLSFIRLKNPNNIISAGCSLGAFHAINLAFKHPAHFCKAVGMSGRYDLSRQYDYYPDLFNGHWDENIYFNSPSQYFPNLQDHEILELMKRMEIILAVGKEDPFYECNRHLSQSLWHKDVWNALYVWEGEAHKAKYWRQMVQQFL